MSYKWKEDGTKKRDPRLLGRPLEKQDEHEYARFLAVYPEHERGFKFVADELGLDRRRCGALARKKGLPRKVHSTVRRKLTPEQRAARTLTKNWFRILHRVRRPLRAKPLTQMQRYYANHEESKQKGRKAAAALYLKVKATGEYKVKASCRNAVSRIARMVGTRRAPRTRTFEYLGCDYPHARAHIEALFLPCMAWHNHGDVWEIDHIKPLAAFDLMDDVQLRKATHYTNLQPLLKEANRAKSAKYAGL